MVKRRFFGNVVEADIDKDHGVMGFDMFPARCVDAQIAFLIQQGIPPQELKKRQIVPHLREIHSARYKSPLSLGDNYGITTELIGIEENTLQFKHRMYWITSDASVAEGFARHVFTMKASVLYRSEGETISSLVDQFASDVSRIDACGTFAPSINGCYSDFSSTVSPDFMHDQYGVQPLWLRICREVGHQGYFSKQGVDLDLLARKDMYPVVSSLKDVRFFPSHVSAGSSFTHRVQAGMIGGKKRQMMYGMESTVDDLLVFQASEIRVSLVNFTDGVASAIAFPDDVYDRLFPVS